MGCVLSSTTNTPSNSNTKLQTSTTHRSPPLTLPFLEQEEVKEILSETPIIITNPINHSIRDEKNNILEKKFSFEKNQSHNIHDTHVFKIARIFNPKDELSRVGSDQKEIVREPSKRIRVGSDPKAMTKELSRSIRVGSDPKEMTKELSRSIRVGSDTKETTKDLGRHIRVGSDSKEMITDIRQRSPANYRNNTSPVKRSGNLSGSGRVRNTSPARKSDHLSGSGQTRNNSPNRVGSGKNMGGLLIKDNGESSSRRSRSPVICGDQINGGTRNSISRCPSTRKSGKSPGRVRSELGDRRRSPAEAGNNNNYKRSLTCGNNESIENPLVTLECFIFI
ncbi:hypothetical protein R3W88_007476 [Solanum pinnatisectum]|uniref:Uncharacterized protein n=1 Tax=Solanum pinnatisectum TaxID=50273 RepID=A0AAV9M8A6_9SOLN|nr:hypothetical protein R3W88_007476 [Solanum pinnatisectum]